MKHLSWEITAGRMKGSDGGRTECPTCCQHARHVASKGTRQRRESECTHVRYPEVHVDMISHNSNNKILIQN